MQLIPRHKRTWLLVLLGVAIVGAVGIRWVATAKSEFERTFDRIQCGMGANELQAILGPRWNVQELGFLSTRLVFNDADDEVLTLEIDTNCRIKHKEFAPASIATKLRRLWQRNV